MLAGSLPFAVRTYTGQGFHVHWGIALPSHCPQEHESERLASLTPVWPGLAKGGSRHSQYLKRSPVCESPESACEPLKRGGGGVVDRLTPDDDRFCREWSLCWSDESSSRQHGLGISQTSLAVGPTWALGFVAGENIKPQPQALPRPQHPISAQNWAGSFERRSPSTPTFQLGSLRSIRMGDIEVRRC